MSAWPQNSFGPLRKFIVSSCIGNRVNKTKSDENEIDAFAWLREQSIAESDAVRCQIKNEILLNYLVRDK